MKSDSRIIESRLEPRVVVQAERADPLDDQVIWYLDRIIGVAWPNGDLASAVLSVMGDDGPGLLAAALHRETACEFQSDSSRVLAGAIDEFISNPAGFPGRETAQPSRQSQPGGMVPDSMADSVSGADPFTNPADMVPPESTRAVSGPPSSLPGPSSGSQGGQKAHLRAHARVEKALFSVFQERFAGRTLGAPLAVAEERVARIFNLSSDEIAALSFLFTLSENNELASYMDALPLAVYHSCMAAATGMQTGELKKMLSVSGRLVSLGFVRPDFLPPPHYALGSDIAGLYRDPASSPLYARPVDDFVRESGCMLFPLETFPVSTIARELFTAFLAGQNGHLLVHGEPGTGKTSFVASAITGSGRQAFVLRLVGEGDERSPEFIKLRMAAYLCAGAGAILVVDEADSLINTASRKPGEALVTKAWLTEFMDAAGAPVVWIANDIEGVHEAVRRRFVYSLRFKGQTDAQRGQLWRRLAADSEAGRFLRDGDIERLSRDYRVNASGISVVLRGFDQASRSGVLGREAELRHLSELLTRYQTLVHGEEPDATGRSTVSARFVPEAVCTDVPMPRILAGLRGIAARVRSRLELEASGATVPDELVEGAEAKLLFYGPPGTGKTAYARYLATELDLPLVQKRASDLLGMFVGQTEKSIAAVFAEAEDRGALLFLDEVDSLVVDRRSARESWARSQVNELLSRMEDYRGVMVCCTNFMEGLDPAVLRRFQWKVAFRPPEPSARLALYRRYFEDMAGPLSDEDLLRIRAMGGLCPGDMAAVHRAVAGLKVREDEAVMQVPTHAELASMLEAELRVRATGQARAIGFANRGE